MRNIRSAKNKTRYQNIPPRYQTRAACCIKWCKKGLTVPSFDTVRPVSAAVAVSI